MYWDGFCRNVLWTSFCLAPWRLNFFLVAPGSWLLACYFFACCALFVSFCLLFVPHNFMLVTFCSLPFAIYFLHVTRYLLFVIGIVCTFLFSFWTFLLSFRCNYAPYVLINFKVVLLFCAVTSSKKIVMSRNYFLFIHCRHFFD